MTARAQRAQARREAWTAEVVEPGQSKGLAYASLSPVERLRAFTALNRRVWSPGPPALPRHEWPGEVFEARRRG